MKTLLTWLTLLTTGAVVVLLVVYLRPHRGRAHSRRQQSREACQRIEGGSR